MTGMIKTYILPVATAIILLIAIVTLANILVQENMDDTVQEIGNQVEDALIDGRGEKLQGLLPQTLETIIVVVSEDVESIDSLTFYVEGDPLVIGMDRMLLNENLTYDGKKVIAIVPLRHGVLEKVVLEADGRTYEWSGEIPLGNGGIYIVVLE